MKSLPASKENKRPVNWPTKWPKCPFCGGKLTSDYSSTGTHLYCEGCHGTFTFPAFPDEVGRMWSNHMVFPEEDKS